uniref:Uncharacterized protein n=1 Tax=Candida parapsilosis (strain CDC 317 / ATCC MYA-4646) TaxID=578454 RepID=A0AAJ8W1P0_CANPC
MSSEYYKSKTLLENFTALEQLTNTPQESDNHIKWSSEVR